MNGFYWIKLTVISAWEPACRIFAEDGKELWYVTGSAQIFAPAVIGSELKVPK